MFCPSLPELNRRNTVFSLVVSDYFDTYGEISKNFFVKSLCLKKEVCTKMYAKPKYRRSLLKNIYDTRQRS